MISCHLSSRREYDFENPPYVPRSDTEGYAILQSLLYDDRIIVSKPPTSFHESETLRNVNLLSRQGWFIQFTGIGATSSTCYYEVRLLGISDALLAHVRENSIYLRKTA